jgi:hypothetical protein
MAQENSIAVVRQVQRVIVAVTERPDITVAARGVQLGTQHAE